MIDEQQKEITDLHSLIIGSLMAQTQLTVYITRTFPMSCYEEGTNELLFQEEEDVPLWDAFCTWARKATHYTGKQGIAPF
jgi:hypothetical protein